MQPRAETKSGASRAASNTGSVGSTHISDTKELPPGVAHINASNSSARMYTRVIHCKPGVKHTVREIAGTAGTLLMMYLQHHRILHKVIGVDKRYQLTNR